MPLPLTVSCFSKIQIGFTFLVPAYLGSPRKRAVKRVCVYIYMAQTVTYIYIFYICLLIDNDCMCRCYVILKVYVLKTLCIWTGAGQMYLYFSSLICAILTVQESHVMLLQWNDSNFYLTSFRLWGKTHTVRVLAEARIWICWNKFRQLVPLLTNKDVSLIMRGRLYSSCVRSSMLHGEVRPGL